jgi:phosphoenolpyruvate carboxylase
VSDSPGQIDPEGPSDHPAAALDRTEGGPDAALRADIRRIGKLLGQTLARQEGPPLLDLVEEIRALVRTDAEGAADRLSAMDITTGTKLARAFSTYFHLANIT